MSAQERIDLERKIRLCYDERLGDYENAGFRSCEGGDDPELRRCLIEADCDDRVPPHEDYGCSSGHRAVDSPAPFETPPCRRAVLCFLRAGAALLPPAPESPPALDEQATRNHIMYYRREHVQ